MILRRAMMEISGDGAVAGGLMSALILWIAKLLIGRTLTEVTDELKSLRAEVAQLNKEVSFIRGRLRRKGVDDESAA